MDDFSGDITTTGLYNIGSDPLAVRSDFASDSDWIKLDSLKEHYSYEFLLYPSFKVFYRQEFKIRDLVGNEVWDARFSKILYQHEDPTGIYFAEIESTPFGGNETGEFNLFAFTTDESPNEIGIRTPVFWPNRGFHAGALERYGDVDFYKVPLTAGQRYVFDLHGAASYAQRRTLLTDPILRIHDASGKFLVGDNNSGTGTNASLVFRPDTTGNFYLKVVGANNSAGSYSIVARDYDDFPAAPTTSGQITVGGPAATVKSDFESDSDWLRTTLQKNVLYKVKSTSDFYSQLYDSSGDQIQPEFQNSSNNIVDFRPDQSGVFYLSGFANQGESAQISVTTDLTSKGNFPHPAVNGEITSETNTNIWDLQLVNYGFYFVDLVTNGNDPLETAKVEFKSIFGDPETFDLARQGFLRDMHFSGFAPNGTRDYTATVTGDGNDTGGYQLRITQIDVAQDDKSTLWESTFVDGTLLIRNAIDNANDVDFHKIKLAADQWYSVNLRGIDSGRIHTPSNGVVELIGGISRTHYIYTKDAGDYFFEAAATDLKDDGATVGGFEIALKTGSSPTIFSGEFSWPDPGYTNPANVETINVATRYTTGGTVDLYSDIALKYDGGTIAANELKSITQDQWNSVTPADNDFDGNGEITVRHHRAGELGGTLVRLSQLCSECDEVFQGLEYFMNSP